jgi:hypothetical protein
MQNITFVLIPALSDGIAGSSGTSLLFPVYNLTVTLLDCMQTEGNAAYCYTITHLLAGWLVHCIISKLEYFFDIWQITSMICVQMRRECWAGQGSLSCSQWNTVFFHSTGTVYLHNYMPGCESNLAVTASWLISVCGIFYVVSEAESLMYGGFYGWRNFWTYCRDVE